MDQRVKLVLVLVSLVLMEFWEMVLVSTVLLRNMDLLVKAVLHHLEIVMRDSLIMEHINPVIVIILDQIVLLVIV
jgi:hypothetical protein